MQGIILATSLHDYKSVLKKNDLVCVDNHFYNLEKIDNRYMKRDDEPDNEYMYFITEPVSGELMNFKRSEISKANIGIYNHDKYFNNNIKILLGDINPSDLRNIKAKYALEWDISTADIEKITLADILELTFDGDIIEKEFESQNMDELPTIIKYFKIK